MQFNRTKVDIMNGERPRDIFDDRNSEGEESNTDAVSSYSHTEEDSDEGDQIIPWLIEKINAKYFNNSADDDEEEEEAEEEDNNVTEKDIYKVLMRKLAFYREIKNKMDKDPLYEKLITLAADYKEDMASDNVEVSHSSALKHAMDQNKYIIMDKIKEIIFEDDKGDDEEEDMDTEEEDETDNEDDDEEERNNNTNKDAYQQAKDRYFKNDYKQRYMHQ